MSVHAATTAIKSRMSELVAERSTLLQAVRALDADIATLKQAERILNQERGPRPDGKTAKPNGCLPGIERGAFTRAVLETLRDAGRPMTSGEAGEAALARLGLAADVMTRTALCARVGSIAATHVRKGTLRRIDDGGGPYLIEVAR